MLVKQIETKKCPICNYYYAAFFQECPAKCNISTEKKISENEATNKDTNENNNEVK